MLGLGLAGHAVSDAAYEAARCEFDNKTLVDLTLAIIAINRWSRLAVAFRSEAGSFELLKA